MNILYTAPENYFLNFIAILDLAGNTKINIVYRYTEYVVSKVGTVGKVCMFEKRGLSEIFGISP